MTTQEATKHYEVNFTGDSHGLAWLETFESEQEALDAVAEYISPKASKALASNGKAELNGPAGEPYYLMLTACTCDRPHGFHHEF